MSKGGVTIKTINNKKYYYYQWYENGKIRVLTDWDQDKFTEFDEQGNITKQGKAN